ncbi:alcohol dehydrogenase catalytic domain-containing protein [Mycolicibacterium sp. P9-64]|uniref:alcohol dehydrogenase catalytic domain-containing protein n=1 Tax=Mycolicibacterium sp. P9-64 TaxID=2024612 RepID=UPI0018D73821|nr:alcohol dehydrogenase catalytic domain-containing protein [Mycolicibacterium sp. P9-64]
MLAAFYDRQGAAADVLRVGELPDPRPAAGEVRIRLTVSGINPGDTKKRSGWLGNRMSFSRVVPHSDGAGVVDAVGSGVDEARIGQRVWVYGAQSYRPFGTAAQLTVVPSRQAVALPDSVSDDLGACLGIPGITGHRCVFGDGPVSGQWVLVHGVLGGVGAMAAQLARWGGASVIGTVRSAEDIAEVDAALFDSVVALSTSHPARLLRTRHGRFSMLRREVWIASLRCRCPTTSRSIPR